RVLSDLFSRTVIMSLILSSLYVLNYFGKKRIVTTTLIAIMVMVGLIASSYLFIYKQSPFLASVVYRVADKQNLEKQPTLIMGHRYAAFIANWSMFVNHPLLGVGPFMAMYNFDKYHPAGYKYPLPWLASHNQYLQLLAEKGIFGFILFICFLVMIIRTANRAIKKSPDPEYKALLTGLKASIFLCMIASLTLETSYELQFWLTAGMIMAIANLINKETDA
ncbi:O-antigen ligase domain-containing protein, partial [bacterium]